MKPILAVLILGIAASAAETPLKIGDPAPPIVVAKWFKNEAPGALAGKVTVVEFWATWCGPCKKGIPHLTELAKEYQGKARIIGVSIWEAEKTDHDKRLAAVGKFVDSMGDTMDYSVAADDNAGTMAKTWMEAANEKGIPTAFVIGKDGRIAWIGNPWEGLDKALADAVNGRLDTTAIADQAAARQKAKDAKETIRLLLEPVNQLVADNQHAEAVNLLDKLVAGNPELQGKMGYFRYRILKGYDQPAAWRQARALLDGELKDNPGALYSIARDLTDPPGPRPRTGISLSPSRNTWWRSARPPIRPTTLPSPSPTRAWDNSPKPSRPKNSQSRPRPPTNRFPKEAASISKAVSNHSRTRPPPIRTEIESMDREQPTHSDAHYPLDFPAPSLSRQAAVCSCFDPSGAISGPLRAADRAADYGEAVEMAKASGHDVAVFLYGSDWSWAGQGLHPHHPRPLGAQGRRGQKSNYLL